MSKIAHNLKISDLMYVLKNIASKHTHVDAIVVDDLTLRLIPSEFNEEESSPPDINQLIV